MAKKKPELSSEELLAESLVREEDWPYEVPWNWVWVRLGGLCQVKGGKRLPKGHHLVDNKTEHPYIRVTNFAEQSITVDEVKYILPETYEKINRYTISKNDIYISIAGTIGKVGIIPDSLDGGNLTENAAKITNLKGFTQKYLLFILTSTNLQHQISKSTISTTQPKLALFRIEDLIVPLPPLAEQQRIVDRIESLFDKLDQAKDLIQDALDSFENRKAAILHQAFTGQLTKKWREAHGMELESWKETKSESIFEYVTSGSRGWAQYYDTKGSVFIRMGNLDHGTIELDLADIQYVKLPENVEGKRSKVEKNDVLISITADVGMVGLVRNENMDAYINQHVALARPVKSVNTEFIAWFLVSDIGLHQLQSLQRGVTKIGLTLGDIRNLTIKLPCLSEQIEIVRIIDVLFAKEQNAKDLCDLIDQIDAMKKTILGQAFRGELGTNGAGEASAVELLLDSLHTN